MINCFPDYEKVKVKKDYGYEIENWYRGEDVGKGGYVYSKPGMYENVALVDIQSMHPTSAINMNYFGQYTSRYQDIYNARVLIKHGNFEEAGKLMGGVLKPYLNDPEQADQLSKALKLGLNSVYGLSSAKFDNPFRDWRNDNNIIALRGALFMVTLRDEVMKRGFEVAHIKTDSIKIPNATLEIIKFCMDFANDYGYIFDHEATYKKMCLTNKAVYVSKYATVEECEELYGKEYVHSEKDIVKDCKKKPGKWDATGAQFQHPYVFKTLFSKKPIEFSDLCEIKEVKSAIYLDLNESGYPDVSQFEKELTKLSTAYDKSQPDYKEEEFESGRLYSLPSSPGTITDERDRLISEIEKGHNYRFVGKVGEFCPIKPGKNGGLLARSSDRKYLKDSVTGSSDYRWLESEVVRQNHLEDDIDMDYFNGLVDDAVSAISKYCDFEWFASDD